MRCNIGLILVSTVNKDRTIITLQNFKMGAYPFQTINQILNNRKIEIDYPKKVTLPEAQIAKYAGTYINKDDGEEQLITYLEGHLVHNTNKINGTCVFSPSLKTNFRASGKVAQMAYLDLPNCPIKR